MNAQIIKIIVAEMPLAQIPFLLSSARAMEVTPEMDTAVNVGFVVVCFY